MACRDKRFQPSTEVSGGAGSTGRQASPESGSLSFTIEGPDDDGFVWLHLDTAESKRSFNLASLFYESLKHDDGDAYMDDGAYLDSVTLDGSFNLVRAAQKLKELVSRDADERLEDSSTGIDTGPGSGNTPEDQRRDVL